MAKKSESLAQLDPNRDALAAMGDFFDDIDITGLEDVDGEDISLASKIWNMGGLDKHGDPYLRNRFFDTLTEELQQTVECVFLVLQKSNRWDEYDNETEKTNVLCSSQDRIHGRTSDGATRPCRGCPDKKWFTDDKGKPYKRCGEVHTVVGIETHNSRPFLMRFKKTGLKPWRAYLMAHHWSARQSSDGKRSHVPLFAYQATVSLQMHSGGNYALPVIVRGDMLDNDSMRAAYESAKSYLEMMTEVMAHADAIETTHAEVETSSSALSSDDFLD